MISQHIKNMSLKTLRNQGGSAAGVSFRVSGVGANPTLPSDVASTPFPLWAEHQVMSRIWVALRAMGTVLCGVTFSVFGIICGPTFCAGPPSLPSLIKSICDRTHNSNLVPIFTKSATRYFRRRCWPWRNNRNRSNLRRYIKLNLQIPAAAVFLNRNSLQVVLANAAANAAKVVNFIAIRYLAALVLKSETMRRCLRPAIPILNRKRSVAVGASTSNPKPATALSLGDSTPKAALFIQFIHRGIIPRNREVVYV